MARQPRRHSRATEAARPTASAERPVYDDAPKDGADKPLDDHAAAMLNYDEVWEAEKSNRDAGVEDQKFYIGGGGQWDEAAKREREAAGRPCLEINALPATVRQLTGDLRRDTPEIKVLQAGGEATEEVAKIYNGLTRHIQSISDAKAAYVTGAEGAATAGQGGWRVVTQYSNDDGFEQDIRIQRIADPLAIMVDPYCREADRSDMRYAFVIEDVPLAEFKRRYPDKLPAPLDKPIGSIGGWTTGGDTVRIAEYWCKKPVAKTLALLEDGSVWDMAQGAPPLPVKAERKVESHKVVSSIISAGEVLSGPHDWPGKYIPIAFVAGDEVVISGVTHRRGMVRDAKDPQRMYNYTRSAAAEAIALQPKAPWLLTPTMVAGYEDTWDAVGRENLPWLPYTPDPEAPGQRPERVQPALAQAGFDTQAAIAADDIKRVTGIYDASLGARSNETSGVAISARQREGDTTTYLYIDNLARAIRYTGKIIVDLIPKIYDTERVVRTLGEDGTEALTKINAATDDDGVPAPVDASGKQRLWNDLSAGEYDVVVTTGPSFATRRVEAAANMVELVRAAPALMAVGGDLLVKNMDFPGADELAERVKRSIPPQIVGDQDGGDGAAPMIGPDGQPMPPEGAQPQPEPVNPKDVADAEYTSAKAEGQRIDNAFKKIELGRVIEAYGAGQDAPLPGQNPDKTRTEPGQNSSEPTPIDGNPATGLPEPQGGPELPEMQPPSLAQGEGDMPPMIEIGAIDPAQLSVPGTGPALPG
jgi:hypothetical protein